MWKLNEQAGASFPFLLGRAFIEATEGGNYDPIGGKIPFLLGRAFIEAKKVKLWRLRARISLPSGKGFH